MILVIDNYDSFTYNLVHLVAASGLDYDVVRNDTLTCDEVAERAPAGVLISPGPGRPRGAGICLDVIGRLGSSTPVLGVCLGHQAIAEAYGGTVTYAPTLMHGKVSTVQHDSQSIFDGLPQDFVATRYHSLTVDPDSVPDALVVSAWSEDGVIMGLRHREHPVEGVQFHTESVLTEVGPRIVSSWLEQVVS